MNNRDQHGVLKETFSFINDFAVLIKYKLTSFVVFSAMMAYLASIEGKLVWLDFGILFLGGFCITAAANALNQVLEKDYDKLMKRTSDRPIAAGRITSAQGVFAAGLLWIAGMILLAYFNPLATFLGALAVVSYAFVYTPIKRYSTIAVFIGSFPGAIPLLIGNVAATGTINQMGIFLFAIQFIWQFPHFWAIGWLAFEDYKIAGYKLIAEKEGERDPNTGIHAAIYALLFIPLGITGYFLGFIGLIGLIIMSLGALGFAWYGFRLYTERTRPAALALMFASLIYLVIALGAVYFDKII